MELLQVFSGLARFVKSLCNLDTKNAEKLEEICKKRAFFALFQYKFGKNGANFRFLVVLLRICCVTGRAAGPRSTSVRLRSADDPSLASAAKLLTKKNTTL